MFTLPITLYLSTWLLINGFLLIIPNLGLGENTPSYYSNIIQIISSAITAMLCWRTMSVFEYDDPMRSVWSLMGIGIFSWCIGEALYAGYIFFNTGAETPFPWYSDIGFLLMQPFVIIALLTFARAISVYPPIWGILLSIVVLSSALAITFKFEYASLLQANTIIERLAVIGYMLFDPILIATTILIASLLAGGQLAYPWWFSSIGLILYYISNLFQIIGTAEGTYVSGTWTDLGWPLSFVLIGIAAMLVYNMLHHEH